MTQKKSIETKLKAKKWKKVSVASLIGGSLIYLSCLGIIEITKPEVSKQYNIMSNQLYTLKEQKKKLAKKINNFSNYNTPSLNKLNKNFNQEVDLYDNAILEMKQNMGEIEKTSEFIKYEEKKKAPSFLGLGGCGLFIFGLFGQFKSSRLKRKYMEEE